MSSPPRKSSGSRSRRQKEPTGLSALFYAVVPRKHADKVILTGLGALFALSAAMMGVGLTRYFNENAKTTPAEAAQKIVKAVTGKVGFMTKRNADGSYTMERVVPPNVSLDGDEETQAEREIREKNLTGLLAKPLTGRNTRAIINELNALNIPAGRAGQGFTPKAAEATLTFLRENPARIAQVAPAYLELLLAHEHDDMMALIKSSPAAKTEALARIKAANAPHARFADRRLAQTWMAAFGVYTGALDGALGEKYRTAETQFYALAGLAPAPATPAPPPVNLAATKPVLNAQSAGDVSTIVPLSKDQIRELSTILQAKGYLNAEPSGDFNADISAAMMTHLRKNPEDIAHVSTWMMQQLLRHNHQSKITKLIHSTPVVWDKASERLRESSRNYETLEQPQRAAMQVWMQAIGIYSGPANGARNRMTDRAMESLTHYFATADISAVRRQQEASRAPNNRTSEPQAPITVATPEIDRQTIDALITNADFRHSLESGNLARTLQYLEAIDQTPLILRTPVKYNKITHFGGRYHPTLGHYKMHQGTDMSAPSGTRVEAAESGKVVLAKWVAGYGNTIVVDHGRGVRTLSGHLSAINVRVGDAVSGGDKIGSVGSTGRSTGPHLHFEVILRDRNGTDYVVDAANVLERDLSNPKIRFTAGVTAKSIVEEDEHLRLSDLRSDFMNNLKLPPTLTPVTAQTLMTVLAADRTLLDSIPSATTTMLHKMGFRAQLSELGEGRLIHASLRP